MALWQVSPGCISTPRHEIVGEAITTMPHTSRAIPAMTVTMSKAIRNVEWLARREGAVSWLAGVVEFTSTP
ncbi:hypothetical protein TPCV302_12930 [Cutibacterium avidum]|nr:hypothetical protein TPCV302_12930 [Cutibacterium avidum]